MQRTIPLALAALVLVATGACKKKEAAPPPEAPAAAPAVPAPTPAVSALELGRHIGANKRVADTTSTFAPRDTFYLSVVTENTAPGAMLLAKWHFQTGQLVDSTVQAVAAPSAGEPTSVTEFHLVKPKGWPAGTYTVEVFLDGASKGKREFAVKK
ncbi:MAG TPA: hypothetical protein VFV33_13495 [Gemmatimonadaceae bacterium]|nr:hypothetical protein [Gemmatimonadaceae bacterium]